MVERPESRINHDLSEVDLALCRATLFGALALGFRPPTEETITRLIGEANGAALAEAACPLDAETHSQLAAAVEDLTSVKEATVAGLSASYRRLFGHTSRGSVPPYQTEYGAEAIFQQPQELGDLMGFYRAFGLTLNPAEHERPDHVSCECEFLSFLALKEAYALEHQDGAMLEETRKAQRHFLRDHLGRFISAFIKRLAAEAKGSFYGLLGVLCERLVARECQRLGVPVGPQDLTLRPTADGGVPMACGSGTGCPMVPGAIEPEGIEEQ